MCNLHASGKVRQRVVTWFEPGGEKFLIVLFVILQLMRLEVRINSDRLLIFLSIPSH